MTNYIIENGEWVLGSPTAGEKFKQVNSKGGELISYYSEPTPLRYGTKITKRALSQRLNPVIRSAIRDSIDNSSRKRLYFECASIRKRGLGLVSI